MNAGTARLGRAATFAASSVCLAVLAHVVGGATSPGRWTVLASFALLTRLAFGFGARERGAAAVLIGVVATQVALHLTFLLTGSHVHQAGGHGTVDLPMLAAHGVAAVTLAAGLHRAERLLWSVARLTSRQDLVRQGAIRQFVASQVLVRLFLPVADLRVPTIPASFERASRCRAPHARTRPVGRCARRRGPPPAVLPEVGRAVAYGMPHAVH